MRQRPNPAEALAKLPRLTDSGEQRASWRQAIAALGQGGRVVGPPPLDEVETEVLVRAVQVALESGLADDLDWIAPGSAAVALYELSAALPPGVERRELGRRVFARLYEGTAATFAAVATRMALGAGRPLEAPTFRARVGLLFDLPPGNTVHSDALALHLVSRSDMREHWVVEPATGALPARRLSALIIERAAREAALRSQQGDSHPRQLLVSPAVRPTYELLLADREPLVWQHAAVARGLLASEDASLRSEIEVALDPSLTPTEWRRAALSLVALLVGDAETALKQCERLLEGEIAKADPGLAAAMVAALPRVIEAEPDVAEALLDRLSRTYRADVAEAIATLLADLANKSFGERAANTLRQMLAGRGANESAASKGIVDRALRVLDRDNVDDTSVAEAVRQALVAYEAAGARAAHELAVSAVATAKGAMDVVATLDSHDEATLPDVLALLADIDGSILERPRLHNLLLLARRPGESDASVPELEQLYGRLGRWVLDGEEKSFDAPWTRSGSLAGQRRLKTLLHLVDAETAADSDASIARVRERIRRTMQVLVRRLAAGPDGSVHRILCATLARSFDAAVREGVAEPSDLLLAVAHTLSDQQSLDTICEASTNSEVAGPIAAYTAFVAEVKGSRRPMDSVADIHFELGATARNEQVEDVLAVARRVTRLSRGLGSGGSYRGEALRQTILRMGRALEIVAQARGLSDLVDANASSEPLAELEQAIEAYRLLSVGALRRLLDEDAGAISVVADVPPLSALVERAVSAGVPGTPQQMAAAIGELTAELPDALAKATAKVAEHLTTLPVTAASDVYAIPLEKRRTALPDWLLPRRTIGAFYVVRALGSGGVSSVFVARRIEERHNPKAEAFALKVPQFDPTMARSISEQEFLEMFREEAGALLSLPEHPNLSRFVTFDVGAKPKPILVMELIRGVGLDRMIRSRSLTTERVVQYMDGILGGLEAMHQVGVGHLDVKPSNVILRDNETPVLVDFGLSGRQLRPGCGTLDYCSPEVLGVVPRGYSPAPMAADVYAFAATSFELLTTEPLFDAEDEMGLMSAHVSHDGWPQKLQNFASFSDFSDLAVVLAACLRRDPRNRPTGAEVRAALKPAAAKIRAHRWPLPISKARAGMAG